MYAGGVPFENDINSIDIVEVALAFVGFIEHRKREMLSRNLRWFGIRINIPAHSGQVFSDTAGKNYCKEQGGI
jgi:hypothetical protein